ncbi:MAG: tetratricopeptide repeat protein [Xanthobacteraceae bacterium]
MVAAGVCFHGAAVAQQSRDRTWCHDSKSTTDQKIAGCTALIQSGRESRQDLFKDHWTRGDAYREKGDYDHAIADYTEAIRIDPKNISPLINRGMAYYAKKDYDRAIADYDKAMDRCRLDFRCTQYGQEVAYWHRGGAYFAKKDYDRAIADYTEAIRLVPKDHFAFRSRGNAYLVKGDYDRAIADYSQVIWLDPNNAAGYVNRGRAYQAKKNYDHAIADYADATRLDPNNAAAWASQGDAYYDMGKPEQALKSYAEAIKSQPNSTWPYTDRGELYLDRGDYDLAIADFDNVVKVSPTYAMGWNDRCRALALAGRRLEQALSDCNEAIKISPTFVNHMVKSGDVSAIGDRALVHFKAGRFDSAIDDFDKALKLTLRSAEVLYGRGLAKQKKGDAAGGAADIAAAKAIQSDIVDRMATLGVK